MASKFFIALGVAFVIVTVILFMFAVDNPEIHKVEDPCPIVMKHYNVDSRFRCLVVNCKGVEYIYLWDRYSTPVLVTSQVK